MKNFKIGDIVTHKEQTSSLSGKIVRIKVNEYGKILSILWDGWKFPWEYYSDDIKKINIMNHPYTNIFK